MPKTIVHYDPGVFAIDHDYWIDLPDGCEEDPNCRVIDVDEETLDRWRFAMKECDRAQEEIKQAYADSCKRGA